MLTVKGLFWQELQDAWPHCFTTPPWTQLKVLAVDANSQMPTFTSNHIYSHPLQRYVVYITRVQSICRFLTTPNSCLNIKIRVDDMKKKFYDTWYVFHAWIIEGKEHQQKKVCEREKKRTNIQIKKSWPRRQILKIKATAVPLSNKRSRERKTNEELYDRVGEGNYIHWYVHYTGCNHERSVFYWTWDGRTRWAFVPLPPARHTALDS